MSVVTRARRRLLVGVVIACALVGACGKSSPTAPPPPATGGGGGGGTAPPPPAPPPAPTIGYLAGRITQSGPGTPISNARIEVVGGASIGKSTLTNPDGQYTLSNLTLGNNTIRVSKETFITRDLGLVLSNEANMQNVALQTVDPWTTTGTGNNVFEVPTWISRVRVIGTFTGSCSNFVIWIRTSLIVNEIIGRCSIGIGTRYEGVHVTTGGTARVENSTGVAWSITESR